MSDTKKEKKKTKKITKKRHENAPQNTNVWFITRVEKARDKDNPM